MPELLERSVSGEATSPANTLPRSKKQRAKPSPSTAVSRSFVRRAKRVRFFRNGDQFFKGVWYAVTPDRFRSFGSLLEDLTRTLDDLINLPHGVRLIFNLDGSRKIASLLELEDGDSYVCASSDVFKKIDYERAREPLWNYSVPRAGLRDASLCLDASPSVVEANDFVHPRIVTVIRNGVKPRKVIRLLLNKRTAPSLQQVLADLTAAVKLDSGLVKKVFTFNGQLVTSLMDFFKDDDVFIAYGSERMSIDDFYLDSEEYRFLFPPRLRPTSLSRPAPTSAKSPKVVRKTPNRSGLRNDGEGGTGASPILRRRFLHQRNQKKLKSRRRGSPPRSTLDVPVVDSPSDLSSSFLEDDQMPASSWQDSRHPLEVEDRLKIGRLIGDGNFAVVHEAFCKETSRMVAVKIIDKNKCVGKEELVENEVGLLRRVKHQHIVELYDVWDFPGRFYLVMELVKGGDLFDALVSARQFSERESAHLLSGLSSALDYLHRLHIVHRDVKPENLLMVDLPDGLKELKLADLGLATTAEDVLFTVCGTPTYVAPEILLESGYGLKVDVWAAGVILYIMLCGFPPFISMQNSQEELFELILSGKFNFPSPYWENISNAAKGLIQGMLQVDVDDRYSAAEVLIHPWITGEALLEPDVEVVSEGDYFRGAFGSSTSRSFLDVESVEFYWSRRRSMDDLSSRASPSPAHSPLHFLS